MTVPHTKGTGAWRHPTNRDPDKDSVPFPAVNEGIDYRLGHTK